MIGKRDMIGKNKCILILAMIIALAALSGCIENDVPADDSKTNGSVINDSAADEFIYGKATVEDIDILILESFPVQINVNVNGYLPDGCTGIDKITKERDGNAFSVTITTKRPAEAICTQAIVPFQEVISLDVYGLEAGEYTVDVNGVTGSFELATDNILPE